MPKKPSHWLVRLPDPLPKSQRCSGVFALDLYGGCELMAITQPTVQIIFICMIQVKCAICSNSSFSNVVALLRSHCIYKVFLPHCSRFIQQFQQFAGLLSQIWMYQTTRQLSDLGVSNYFQTGNICQEKNPFYEKSLGKD